MLTCGFSPLAFSQETVVQPSGKKLSDGVEIPQAAQDPAEHAKDLESFEIVWDTIVENWWKSEEELAIWEKQRQSFLDRVSNAESRKEIRKLQRELINKLEASHYGIIPGEVYQKLGVKDDGKLDASSLGSVGLKYRLVDDQAIVYQVAKGSAAEKAGVQPGWLLKSLKDQDVPKLIGDLKEALTEKRFFGRIDSWTPPQQYV